MEVTQELEQRAQQAAQAGADHCALCSISCVTSTLASVYNASLGNCYQGNRIMQLLWTVSENAALKGGLMVTKIHAEDRTFKFKVADTKQKKMRHSPPSQMPSSLGLEGSERDSCCAKGVAYRH